MNAPPAALGADHAIHSVTLRKHGVCLARMARYAEAEPALLRARSILEKTFGAGHERTRQAERDLADLRDAWARPSEAVRWRRAGAQSVAR
jgi:hypothetical protein